MRSDARAALVESLRQEGQRPDLPVKEGPTGGFFRDGKPIPR